MKNNRRVTGSQITLMVVAVCAAAVAAPVGVAAAGKKPPAVVIADGTHKSRLAKVTSSGDQVVKISGTASVGGAVGAVPARPTLPFAVSGHSDSTTVHMTAPAGHLVVQTVTIQLAVPADISNAGVDFSYHQGGQSAALYVPLTRISPRDGGSDAFFAAAVPTPIYPDPGTAINIQPQYDAAVAGITDVTLAGYLA